MIVAPKAIPPEWVYNRNFGVVSRIDIEAGEPHADFDGRKVTYGFGELDELALASSTTIHESQGSEYPAVVIPLSTQHYPMLQRNLVYTGVTRGKRLVVMLVGQRKALAISRGSLCPSGGQKRANFKPSRPDGFLKDLVVDVDDRPSCSLAQFPWSGGPTPEATSATPRTMLRNAAS